MRDLRVRVTPPPSIKSHEPQKLKGRKGNIRKLTIKEGRAVQKRKGVQNVYLCDKKKDNLSHKPECLWSFF